jgi:hypothetical protein
MTHKHNGKESDPQAGHKMSDIEATRDRHAGHSAMFRDKFWAVESAGIVLVRSDPRDVVGAIELSRATYKK